uniref:Uncharacterized protein n=1 Tax=Strigamia maritima TaxID=126957 RepID=T1JI89_STRMM
MDVNLNEASFFATFNDDTLEKNDEFQVTPLQHIEIAPENESSESNLDLDEIFTQAEVCIDNAVLNSFSKNPELFLTSLKEICGILIEKSTKSENQYVLRGQWNQILDAYEKIKLNLNPQCQSLTGIDSSDQEKEIQLDKAITCDIIKGDVLTLLSSESAKHPRVVSIIVHRSRSPSQRIKEKYRMKRMHNKSKRHLNPCLKTSNKFFYFRSQVCNKKVSAAEKDVSLNSEKEQSDADRLDTENREPEPLVNDNMDNVIEDYAKTKPKKITKN